MRSLFFWRWWERKSKALQIHFITSYIYWGIEQKSSKWSVTDDAVVSSQYFSLYMTEEDIVAYEAEKDDHFLSSRGWYD